MTCSYLLPFHLFPINVAEQLIRVTPSLPGHAIHAPMDKLSINGKRDLFNRLKDGFYSGKYTNGWRCENKRVKYHAEEYMGGKMTRGARHVARELGL